MLIAVDFDGTIVTHEYPEIGKEIPFAIDVLKRLQTEEHHSLILWTVRTGELLDEAVEYCRKRGLEFYAVNKNNPEETDESPRKLRAEVFIDDRNIGGLMDWTKIYKMIKGIPDDDLYDNYTTGQYRRNPYKRKNFVLRFGEWLDRIGNEMDKRR
jgi:hydroxymethylpyrimidine pyrophosphatase-like HAD family hydrolase